ncbi:hypothetical protein RDWZM_006627 [Blomia tropicalis]|uniref:CDK-activating kinase assembly factor MAT1 n=1 Tax=Blomia tropicalis TaxID=40697 RepID=A0A9Q0M812_BLOTA|nr:CDK-activating kinase assembly factor MAT1 [Blomia tropicalis]KAJ6220815.1 hypothetical protein RDWZM_006627 [Blomia tropicalis]
MENETRCPNCGTTKYANANLKMMVNVCGHALCENCVEQLFVKGAAKCPTCNVILKRIQFRIQLYDDENVEKDLEIRRRLMRDINLKEEDFPSLKEYNDYLELFETFVYNLANDIDTTATNMRIDQFKNDNSSKLKNKKRNKMSKDMELIEQLLEEEREYQMTRDGNFRTEQAIVTASQAAAARKEHLLDDLLSSDLPAELILQRHQRQTENELAAINEEETKRAQQRAAAMAVKRQQKLTFSSGIRLGSGTSVFSDEDMLNEGQPPIMAQRYVYKPPLMKNAGPPCPSPRTIMANNYLVHIRPPSKSEIAGGYSALYPCQRALQEAIMDLNFTRSHRH